MWGGGRTDWGGGAKDFLIDTLGMGWDVDVNSFFCRGVDAQGGASVWVQGIYVVPIPARLPILLRTGIFVERGRWCCTSM